MECREEEKEAEKEKGRGREGRDLSSTDLFF
jgi:hypothetical protein